MLTINIEREQRKQTPNGDVSIVAGGVIWLSQRLDVLGASCFMVLTES